MSGSGDSPPGPGQPASASKRDSINAKPDSTNDDENDGLAEERQQPGEPAANAGQGIPASSSAAGTGQIAVAKVGGSASEPAQQPQLAIKRDVFNPLNGACTWDWATGAWRTPATEPDARLCGLDWRKSAWPVVC